VEVLIKLCLIFLRGRVINRLGNERKREVTWLVCLMRLLPWLAVCQISGETYDLRIRENAFGDIHCNCIS